MQLTRALLPVLALGLSVQTPAELTQDRIDPLLEQIMPAQDELTWGDVDWRASLSNAIVEGRAADKPILLWAMNGHPLGCV